MSKKKSSVEPKPLTPPDEDRCQCLRPNGCSFMTFGGRPERVRCKNKPIVIIREKNPGPDGQCGEMSLCPSCMNVFLNTESVEVTFRAIIRDGEDVGL